MRKLAPLILSALLTTPCFAKLEAFAIMTKRCGEKELRQAAKGGLAKIVSEFNGKGVHGFIIELDLSLITKGQLVQNLMKRSCYDDKLHERHSKMLPEELFSDDTLTEHLFDTEDA